MSLRKFHLLCTVAMAASLAITYYSRSIPYYERLINIQVEQQFGQIDPGLVHQPLDIQALLLDYSGDRMLTLKTILALSRYPAPTREVLQLYGTEPEFKDILRSYGEPVIPVVKYFIDHDVLSLKVMAATAGAVQVIRNGVEAAWNWANGNPPAPASVPQQNGLASKERGWYAVNFVRTEGHQFLGQFDVDANNQAKWNQTNRIVSGVGLFLTGGLANLERKYDLNDEVKIADVFFAGVDVVPMVVALKLLRAGKVVVASGKKLSVVSRTRVFGTRLIPESGLFRSLGKYGAIAATVYIVASHPSLINSLFEEAAKLLGLNPWLVQFFGWAIVISVLLYPFFWLLPILARVLLLALSWLDRPKKVVHG